MLKLRAAIFYGVSEGMKVEDNVEEPIIETHEVLIDVAACGVCHTDEGYLQGVPTFKKPPIILGHEPSGIIKEVGDGVTHFQTGDRVLIPPVFTCGSCPSCRIGRENICYQQIMLGNHVDGAYAEFLKAPSKDLFHLPKEIPLEEASIITDALSTPYHAVKNRAKVKPGDKVVVYGCGGVGLNAVQISAISGAIVIAIDVVPHKLEMAEKLGADYVINGKDENVVKAVRKITSGGADIGLEVIGNPLTIQQAFASVKSGGRLVVVGYSPIPVEFPFSRLMFREMEVLGSLGCRPIDFPPLIELCRKGKLKVKELVTHKFSLDEIHKAFDTLRGGEALRGIIIP